MVPLTVMTSVPGDTVTMPVAGFWDMLAAGTVSEYPVPLGSVRSPSVYM